MYHTSCQDGGWSVDIIIIQYNDVKIINAIIHTTNKSALYECIIK